MSFERREKRKAQGLNGILRRTNLAESAGKLLQFDSTSNNMQDDDIADEMAAVRVVEIGRSLLCGSLKNVLGAIRCGKKMITKDPAKQFAQEWIDAWNAHDLDRVLSHYTDDFEMSSSFIATFASEFSGTLKGKPQVKAYWQTALKRIPDLRFELLDVFTCVDSVTIYYKAVLGKLATEVLFLNQDGKAYRALAHYNS